MVISLIAWGIVLHPARAQTLPSPQRFGSWEVLCPDGPPLTATQPGTINPPCRISQRLAVKDSGQTVFALTVLPGEKKGNLVGIVSIPLGGYIAPGIEMRVDKKKAYKVLVETCNVSGCHAGFPISQALLRDWQRSKELTFRIWTAKAKSSDIAVSLDGFSPALQAMLDGKK